MIMHTYQWYVHVHVALHSNSRSTCTGVLASYPGLPSLASYPGLPSLASYPGLPSLASYPGLPSLASYPGLPSQLFAYKKKQTTFFTAVEKNTGCFFPQLKSSEGRPEYEARHTQYLYYRNSVKLYQFACFLWPCYL